MPPLKLAIVSTHPIQYYVPVFRALTQGGEVLPKVFYTWSQSQEGAVFDPGFGTAFRWDIPLREGYEHEFVPNVSKAPGTHHFGGVRNPRLNDAISAWQPDALLVYGWNLHSHLAAMRHFKGRIPVLFRGDSTLLDPIHPARGLLRKLWLRWVYSHVDTAVAVGRNNHDYYLFCGLSSQHIAFAPHSVDTARFAADEAEQTKAALRRRRQLGIADDAVVMLFAAKFIAKKDPLLLLHAFLTDTRGAHLLFVGNGVLESELRARSRGFGNVHFLPFQNQADMPSVYRSADVYVLPSRGPGETWGLAMNEAMASGRPVIAGSRVGGARDLIQPSTGWTFESGNGKDLERVLAQASSRGRAELLRMGEEARQLSAQWSSEAAAAGIAAAAHSACASVLRRLHVAA